MRTIIGIMVIGVVVLAMGANCFAAEMTSAKRAEKNVKDFLGSIKARVKPSIAERGELDKIVKEANETMTGWWDTNTAVYDQLLKELAVARKEKDATTYENAVQQLNNMSVERATMLEDLFLEKLSTAKKARWFAIRMVSELGRKFSIGFSEKKYIVEVFKTDLPTADGVGVSEVRIKLAEIRIKIAKKFERDAEKKDVLISKYPDTDISTTGGYTTTGGSTLSGGGKSPWAWKKPEKPDWKIKKPTTTGEGSVPQYDVKTGKKKAPWAWKSSTKKLKGWKKPKTGWTKPKKAKTGWTKPKTKGWGGSSSGSGS